VEYRGRAGEWKEPPLTDKRTLEMYFLDVGQDDAAFGWSRQTTRQSSSMAACASGHWAF
jgi:hypothetical protein